MNTKSVATIMLSMSGAEEDYPFGPEVQVFKVKGKMYGLIGRRDGKDFVNLKAKPNDVHFLTEQYQAVTPGYHMNKQHWVSVDIAHPEAAELMDELITASYRLIVSKLSKKQKEELAQLN